jgi:hypothetical protein
MKQLFRALTFGIITLSAAPALAGDVQILDAEASRNGMFWRFTVTLAHADEGWDHYASGWDILTRNGRVLATRELMHPHDPTKPFTRSITGVDVPDGIRTVYIRGICSEAGPSKTLYKLILPQ